MRLEITRKTDLALRALQLLAADPSLHKGEELAAAVGTTPGFLSQALTPLVRAGWIVSRFGARGGYRYAEPVQPPSLLDVISAIEGSLPDDECVLQSGLSCTPPAEVPVCALDEGWQRARIALLDALRGTSALAGADARSPLGAPRPAVRVSRARRAVGASHETTG